MNAHTFLLPDLGEGLTEASIVRWLVAEGDAVTLDQPVAEVETAKAVVEVPTPFAGTVTARHVAVGAVATVGEPLLSVAEVAEAVSVAGAASPGRAAGATGAANATGSAGPAAGAGAGAGAGPAAERGGSGNVLVGYGTVAGSGPRRHRRPRRTPSGSPAAVSPGLTATVSPGLTAAVAPEAGAATAPRVVSPLVRRLAQEWGVDVRTVRGTGHAGLILRRDVERAAADGAGTAGPGVSGALAVSAPPDAAPPARDGERVALSAVAKAAAAVFERSRREIPEVTIWADVDATPLVSLRASGGPGLVAYLARFTLAALGEYPVFNSRFDAERQEIVAHPHVSLGVAVQGARGLVVPAVRNAETLTTTALDTEIRRLTAAARAGEATPGGSTFTLNNYGAFRVDGSTPILNPPQVGMLGVGRITDRPWVVEGQVVVRKVATVTFVFDHRVCDGATAAGFLRVVADAMENPAAAIARL